MAVADRNGLPVSIYTESATPHEVKLTEATLLRMVIPDAPQNLIGDNAYDSDPLDAALGFYGIEVIAPHRRNRRNSTQDRRRLRRYRRRWKIERLFAWLQNFRRLELERGISGRALSRINSRRCTDPITCGQNSAERA
jgi:transposase